MKAFMCFLVGICACYSATAFYHLENPFRLNKVCRHFYISAKYKEKHVLLMILLTKSTLELIEGQ